MSEPKTIEAEVIPPSQAVAVRPEGGEVAKPLASDDSKAPITAAQAKVDAVAALTMSAYQRAATLDLTPEEAAALQADFPDDAFQPGAAGKEHLIYIEHAHLRDRFNSVFGMGKWAIVPRNRWAEAFTIPATKDRSAVEGSRVYVEAMLVVRGCFVGEAVGAMEYYPKNASQNYGDAVEGAKTAAFRRCAKEFGVGLQPWKKEWCEGWWKRRRGGRDFSRNAPGRAGGASTTPAQAPKVAPTRQPATAPAPNAPAAATDKTRWWMIAQLKAGQGDPNQRIAHEYFVKVGQILETENIEDLPLRFVPINRAQLLMLTNAIADFESGHDAVAAFPPNREAPPDTPKAPAAPAKAVEVPRDPAGPPPADPKAEWFLGVIVPVPRKGQKRDDYLKHPDTIGSLFNARHGQDADSQEARQRLWGFVNHFEPKGWTKRDGTEMPPSAADKKFREALDAFADWFQREHPDEKL